MKSGPMPLPMPLPGGAPAPRPSRVAPTPRLRWLQWLMGLDGWPQDHGIRIQDGGVREPLLVRARATTQKHVIDVVFDAETGRYLCTNCQSIGIDLPAPLDDAFEAGLGLALTRGLTLAAATALFQCAAAMSGVWPDGLLEPTPDLPGASPREDEAGVVVPGAVRRKRTA